MGFDQWRRLKSHIPFHERYIRVRKDILMSPEGVETDYVFLEDEIPGTVVVLAITDEQKIALVRQYRYPIQCHQYNLPGGAIDAGEEPEEAARRELREETGIIAEEWTALGMYHPMASHHTRKAYLFIAKGLTFGEQYLDPFEDIRVEFLPIKQVVEWIHNLQLTDIELGYAVLLARSKGYIE
ncbi:NUDIX domain-containing protein [Ammoniphilus sp. CFH 90114]|uniref:NUDIX domain-containing protein n=1 Tax=Ammoniphilus sp. CFH 90114 TaxID=2493665 RepID=UPI0013E93AD2|nr:NUDIX hydrolase [Ammoniphilus sp. CFH 90114]